MVSLNFPFHSIATSSSMHMLTTYLYSNLLTPHMIFITSNLTSLVSPPGSLLISSLFNKPSKCKYMFFQRSNSSFVNSLPPLLISDFPIDRVYFFKYLGVFLTPSLSFSMHISHICKKSRKVIGLIFRHFYPLLLLFIYNSLFSLVHPILEYCSPVWSPSSLTLSAKLNSVIYFALIIASKFNSDSIPSIISSHYITSLSSLFAKSMD